MATGCLCEPSRARCSLFPKKNSKDQTPHPELTPSFSLFPPLSVEEKKNHNVLVSSQRGKEFFVLVLTGATGREEEDPAEGGSEVKCGEIRWGFSV